MCVCCIILQPYCKHKSEMQNSPFWSFCRAVAHSDTHIHTLHHSSRGFVNSMTSMHWYVNAHERTLCIPHHSLNLLVIQFHDSSLLKPPRIASEAPKLKAEEITVLCRIGKLTVLQSYSLWPSLAAFNHFQEAQRRGTWLSSWKALRGAAPSCTCLADWMFECWGLGAFHQALENAVIEPIQTAIQSLSLNDYKPGKLPGVVSGSARLWIHCNQCTFCTIRLWPPWLHLLLPRIGIKCQASVWILLPDAMPGRSDVTPKTLSETLSIEDHPFCVADWLELPSISSLQSDTLLHTLKDHLLKLLAAWHYPSPAYATMAMVSVYNSACKWCHLKISKGLIQGNCCEWFSVTSLPQLPSAMTDARQHDMLQEHDVAIWATTMGQQISDLARSWTENWIKGGISLQTSDTSNICMHADHAVHTRSGGQWWQWV